MHALTSLKLDLSDTPLGASPTNLAMVAILYFAFGRLALMLAISPGYAAPVWPAAGVAVAAVLLCGTRIWPGIFFGSLLINLFAGFAPGMQQSAAVVSSSVLIAAGATLQALVGALLVRAVNRPASFFDSARNVTRFLIAAGPLACLVNALLAPTALIVTGIIGSDYFAVTSWTWWIGDTIGVIVIAPLALIASGHAGPQWVRRRLQIGVPMGLAIALVITIYINASSRESIRIEAQFRNDVATASEALSHNLSVALDTVTSLRAFFDSSSHVSRQEFRHFTEGLLARHPEILALSWSPYLSHEQRWQFEAQLQANDPASMGIVETGSRGEMVPAAPADDYVVVQYIEPMDHNATAIGYNVLAEPVRRHALARAVATQAAAATGGVRLVQDSDNRTGLLIFTPVYPSDRNGKPDSARRADGFVTAVILVDDLIANAIDRLPLHSLQIRLFDMTDDNTLLGEWPAQPAEAAALQMGRNISFAGRDWRLEIGATRQFIAAHQSDSLWVILAGGLSLSGMLGSFLIVLTGHGFRERERLDELERVNRNLEENVVMRQRIENELWSEKARAEAMLHSIADGVIAVDPMHRIEYMNPVAEQLTGWSLSDAQGRPIDEVFRLHTENEQDICRGAVELCLQTDDDALAADELWLSGRDGNQYAIRQSTRELRVAGQSAGGLVIAFQDVTAARRLAREMQHQATHDALTGVVNRAEFQRRLQTAIDNVGDDRHAIFFMDLDHFKQVNDTAGHSAGDEFLRGICARIRDQVRARDTLARLGGDEFGLLLEHCPLERATDIAENIVAAVRAYRLEWKNESLGAGISIGVAGITRHCRDIAEIMRQADVACYAAKELGRNRVYLADPAGQGSHAA